MLKILSVFSISSIFFPGVAYCNTSFSDKQLIVSGKKAFKQERIDKLVKIKNSSVNEELNNWFSFWIIKLKIKENPFDKKIKNELEKFTKFNKLNFLNVEAYKFWAHEVIKRKNWEKTILTVNYIKTVFPPTTSKSIQCITYLSKKTKNFI
jgi:hypothetical protein